MDKRRRFIGRLQLAFQDVNNVLRVEKTTPAYISSQFLSNRNQRNDYAHYILKEFATAERDYRLAVVLRKVTEMDEETKDDFFCFYNLNDAMLEALKEKLIDHLKGINISAIPVNESQKKNAMRWWDA